MFVLISMCMCTLLKSFSTEQDLKDQDNTLPQKDPYVCQKTYSNNFYSLCRFFAPFEISLLLIWRQEQEQKLLLGLLSVARGQKLTENNDG